MNIIIVGDGKVGYTLAEYLSKEDHDVTLVDRNQQALDKATETLDVMGVKGNGANVRTLLEAGADEADILIAVTTHDETNMVCCLAAKQLGAKYTIARIRDPEYTESISLLQNGMGIDLVVIDVLLLTLIPGMGTEALAALEDSYQAVILQSFGVGGLPGGGSGPFAQAVERWLQAGKTIVMLTQVPYEGSDMAVYQVGYQVKEKYRLLEGYNMTLEAAVTKLMWVLGRTRDPEQVEALFYRPVQWDIIR